MPIDLKKQTTTGLRNLLNNSRRLHNAEMERAVVQEMHERDLATSREYATFPWNQDRVDQVMGPFARIAASVPNNQRKSYVPAGGRKRGSPKEHPKHSWIDSYSAIKTANLNAVFGCQISKPGDDPQFTLYLGSDPRREAQPFRVYNADQLQEAFGDWKDVAPSTSEAKV
jgi:hypothetical protein